MFKIQRTASSGDVIFKLSGRLAAENVAELKKLFVKSEARERPIILDLRDMTLVDRDAVRFLGDCETDGVKLTNCPAYIREWIVRERKAE